MGVQDINEENWHIMSMQQKHINYCLNQRYRKSQLLKTGAIMEAAREDTLDMQ